MSPARETQKSPDEQPPANRAWGGEILVPAALVYTGLGMIFNKKLREWFPDAATWIELLSLLLVIGGGAVWVLMWRRARKSSPA